MPQIVRMKVRDAGRFAGSRHDVLGTSKPGPSAGGTCHEGAYAPRWRLGFRGDAFTGPPTFSSFEGGVPSRPSSAAIVEPRRGDGNGEVCGNTSFRGETAAPALSARMARIDWLSVRSAFGMR
jgi:hypothetical protein